MATSLTPPPPPGFEIDQPEAQTPAPPAGFVLDASSPITPPPPPGFQIDSPQKPDIQVLARTPHFDPAAYAHETGDIETAFQARQAKAARSFGEKAAAFGHAAADPAVWGGAVKGAAKFAGGLVATPLHTVAQIGATVGAPIARAAGYYDLSNTLENEQQTQGAEALLAAQHIEQNLRGLGRGTAQMATGLVSTPDEATERARFAQEIADYRAQLALAEQRPIDTGAMAAVSRLATGHDPSQTFSPEALQAQGARAASPLVVEMGAASADPVNLALPLAGKIPGVATVAGGAVQGVGKALRLPAKALSYVPKLNAFTKGGLTAGAVLESAMNPAMAAKAAGAAALGKSLGWLGEGLDAQGRALRTGIPSALDLHAAAAKAAGRSAFGVNAQRLAGNTAAHMAGTAIGFAPVNYVMAGGDPERFADSEVGASVMGAMFALPGETFANRRQMQNIQAYRFAQHGAQRLSQNPAYPAHEAVMAQMEPEYRDQINRLRAYLHAGTGTDVLVLDGANYAQAVGAIGGDTRGVFHPTDSAIYINADAVSNADAAKMLGTVGHESGHAIVEWLRTAGREGEANGLFEAIKNGMSPEQLQALTSSYREALSKGTPAAPGETPEQRADIERQIAGANPEAKILEENLSEIVRDILDGRAIESFSLPKPVLERLADSVAGWMERRGWLNPIDPNAKLGFKAQAVKEAARQAKTLLYETGQRASESMQQPTAEQEMIRLQREIDAIPPFNPQGVAATERANAQRRQRLQRELAQWERRDAGMPDAPQAEAAPDGTPAPEPAPDPVSQAAEQLRAEGNRTPYPAVRQAMQRNPAAATAEQIVETVKALAIEKTTVKQATDILTGDAWKYTPAEARQHIDTVITQHQQPVTDVQKLVRAASRVKAGGKVEPGEFNRPEKPEVRVGIKFSDHQGQTRTVTGTEDRVAQPGDFIETRQGVRRVVGPSPDGKGVETVGPFIADETRTVPVSHGAYAVLTTTAAPAATPPSPAPESKPPTPAPVPAQAATPAPAAGEPSPIPGLDAAPGAGTPEPAVPERRVVPFGQEFIIIDRADNPINKRTYKSEASALAAIRQMEAGGQRPALPPPVKDGLGNPIPDALDAITEQGGGGIYWDSMSKEEREATKIPAHIRGILRSSNPKDTPDAVAGRLADSEEKKEHGIDSYGDGTPQGLFDAINDALRGRAQGKVQRSNRSDLNLKQNAAEKAGQSAWEQLPRAIQDKLADDPSGDTLTTAEKQAVNAAIPGTFKITPQEAAQARIDQSNAPEPPTGPVSQPPTGEPIPPRGTQVLDRDVAPADSPQSTPLRLDEIEQVAASAKEAAVAAEKPKKDGTYSQAAQDRIRKAELMAVIRAHSDRLPLNHEGIRLRVDPFGRETVSGKLDESADFDNWLINQSSLAGKWDAVGHLLTLQNSLGKTVQIDYGHAPTGDAAANADARRAAQDKASAEDRAAGEAPMEIARKTAVPLEIQYNPGTESFTVLGASPEKLLSNWTHLQEAYGILGEPMPYRDIHDPRLVADMKGYVRNHQNNRQGDGSEMRGAQGEHIEPTGPAYPIAEPQFEFLNAMMGDESAKSNTPQGKAKSALAQFNDRMVNTQAGETNPLRERINAKMREKYGEWPVTDEHGNPVPGRFTTWTKGNIENPLSEALRPDLIQAIHPELTSEDASIRPAGYRGDIGRFLGAGIPERGRVAAGFMPEDTSVQGKARARQRDRHLGKLKTVNTEQERIAAAGRFMPEERERDFIKARTSVFEAIKAMARSRPVDLSTNSWGGERQGGGWNYARNMSNNAVAALNDGKLMERELPAWAAGILDIPERAVTQRVVWHANIKAQNIYPEYHHVGSGVENFYHPDDLLTQPKFWLGLAEELKNPSHKAKARQEALRAWQAVRESLIQGGDLGTWSTAKESAAPKPAPLSPRWMDEVKKGMPFRKAQEKQTQEYAEAAKRRELEIIEEGNKAAEQFPETIAAARSLMIEKRPGMKDKINRASAGALEAMLRSAGEPEKATALARMANAARQRNQAQKSSSFLPEEAGAENASEAIKARAAKLWKEKGTESPFFKRWFGASKVVDAEGKPKVVFHATAQDINQFERGEFGFHFGSKEQADIREQHSNRYGDAPLPVRVQTYLSLQNPLRIDDPGIFTAAAVARAAWAKDAISEQEFRRFDASGSPYKYNDPKVKELRELLKSKGYDGLVYSNQSEIPESQAHLRRNHRDRPDGVPELPDSYLVFDPEQIKSATGNQGTFDAQNPDIRFMPEDTGKPEEGKTPQERLTREAEAAGVSLSLETLKALTRGDVKAMASVRQRIREQTGREPRFMPEEGIGGYADPRFDIPEKQQERIAGVANRRVRRGVLDQNHVVRQITREEAKDLDSEEGAWWLFNADGSEIVAVAQPYVPKQEAIVMAIEQAKKYGEMKVGKIETGAAQEAAPRSMDDIARTEPREQPRYEVRNDRGAWSVVNTQTGALEGKWVSQSTADGVAERLNREAERRATYEARPGTGRDWNVVNTQTGEVHDTWGTEQVARQEAVRLNQTAANQRGTPEQRPTPRLTEDQINAQWEQVIDNARRELGPRDGLDNMIRRAWGTINNEVIPDYAQFGRLGEIIREAQEGTIEAVQDRIARLDAIERRSGTSDDIQIERARLGDVRDRLEARARSSMPRLPQPRSELSDTSPLAEIHTDLDGKIIEQQKGIEDEIKSLTEQIDQYDAPQANYENRIQKAELEEFRRSLVEDHANLNSLRESLRLANPTTLTEFPRAFAEVRRLEVRGLVSHERAEAARKTLADRQDTEIARQIIAEEEARPARERQGRIDAKIRVAQREAAAERTQQQTLWDDLLQAKDAKNLPKVAKLWQQVSRKDEAFAYGRTKATDPAEIAKEMSNERSAIRGRENSAGSIITFSSSNGDIQITDANGRPKISAPGAGSSGKKEGGGSQLYQAAFAWAHNNGKVIHPSNALSAINAYVRRTSNMLSSALRFGTTRHMIPDNAQGVKNWQTPSDAKQQFQLRHKENSPMADKGEYYSNTADGSPALFDTAEQAMLHARARRLGDMLEPFKTSTSSKTQDAADANNIAQLAMRESEQVMKAVPSLQSLDFDFKTGKMKDANGKEVTPADLGKLLEAAGKANTYDKGIGLSTAQRAIITASAIREADGGQLARADGRRGVRVVAEQKRLLYMPETGESPKTPQERARERIAGRTPASAPAAKDWDAIAENLRDDVDAFAPARDTGRKNYELDDVIDRFVEFAKTAKAGIPLEKLVSEFAKTDEASLSQIRKLNAAARNVDPQLNPKEAAATRQRERQHSVQNGEPVTPAERREAMQNPAPGEQRFMPDEDAPQPPERPARTAKLPEVQAYGRERRAWIDRFVEWSAKQPRNKPIVLADGDDRTGVITPAIGGGYRITRYLDIDGEQVPHGHMEFPTREEAVRDALTSDGFKGASDRRFMPDDGKPDRIASGYEPKTFKIAPPKGSFGDKRQPDDIAVERWQTGLGKDWQTPSVFFAPDGAGYSDYGPDRIPAAIHKDAKIYQGESSIRYAQDHGLYKTPQPEVKEITGWETVDEAEAWGDQKPGHRVPEGIYNPMYAAAQAVAKRHLQEKGYDGAHWSYEDELSPEQYQIWNKDVIRFMPESSPEAPRQRPDPRSAARLRISARTQQERPEREMATVN